MSANNQSEEAGSGGGNLVRWFAERLHLNELLDFLSRKEVPRHRHSFWYVFGGLALFFLGVQILTGVLLALYYSPTPETANESVSFIIHKVPFGWLIRSIHSWSANLMVATVFVHFFSTFFMKAYRRPREMMWMSGVVLLMLVLGFAFTGYLLPWDTTAYFATQIGTEIPRSIPVLGEIVVKILRGGSFIAEESLKRLFAIHAIILPVISLVVVLFHLILSQIHGSSIPIGVELKKRSLPFYPNYMLRDAFTWVLGLMVLLSLCFIFPVQIGPKVDPLASAPVGIKPEWYFLTLYQTLRMLPGQILGIDTDLLVNVGLMLLGLFLVAVPLLDRKALRGEAGKAFTVLGVAGLCYMVVTIGLAYLT